LKNLSFRLSPRPPFRLDLTVWVLRRRPHNLMDRWDGRVYRRVLVAAGKAVAVAARQTGPPEAPEIRVEAQGEGLDADQTLPFLKLSLAHLLGLEADLSGFYRLAAADARLGALVHQFRGVKPPRFPTVFEALVNAVACQQLSLTVGIHLLNRLAAAYGAGFPAAGEPAAAFPRAADLAGADPEALRGLGLSRSKGRTLVELAQGVVQGRVDLEKLAALKDEAAGKYLAALKGIGRWTAEYTLLRGLGRWHIFPGDDVGARHKLEAWLKAPEPLDYQGVGRLLAGFYPYGGLIYFHLLLSQLAAEGHLAP
jgi:DNA-3-methyladenine glycosylase II